MSHKLDLSISQEYKLTLPELILISRALHAQVLQHSSNFEMVCVDEKVLAMLTEIDLPQINLVDILHTPTTHIKEAKP